MTHLIAGYGEVGQGLGHVLEASGQDFTIYDPVKGWVGTNAPDRLYDVIHICFPWSNTFIQSVKDLEGIGRLIIIHATVPVGTTSLCGDVAYSFVRGRHPHLDEMVHHVKYVGAVNQETRDKASECLLEAGFTIKTYDKPEIVELGKLWDTTYYGICIAATKLAKEMADHYDIPWEAMAHMNKSYNAGAEVKFRRPELDPIDGPIGGHCVVPNARILNETFDHPLLDGVLRYAKDKKDALE